MSSGLRGNVSLTVMLFRASYVRFDHNSTTATITGERKEFGYSDANTAFRLQGTTAPKHMIRRIRRRDLNPQKPPTESTFSISYYRRWRDEDLLFTIPWVVLASGRMVSRILADVNQRTG